MEGLIFGGAYLYREICVSKSTGLALQLKVNLPFFLCFTLYLRAIFQVQALGGRFNKGFFALPVWGTYIWRGLYTEGLIFGILRYPLLSSFRKSLAMDLPRLLTFGAKTR